jgi:hypothetical protein
MSAVLYSFRSGGGGVYELIFRKKSSFIIDLHAIKVANFMTFKSNLIDYTKNISLLKHLLFRDLWFFTINIFR